MSPRPSREDRVADGIAKAWAALQSGDPGEALRHARSAHAADPSDVEARYVRGVALLESGDPVRAVPDLRAAAGALPAEPDVVSDLGLALFDSAQFAEAEPHLKKAVDLGTDDAEVWVAGAVCLERRGAREEAERFLARAHELAPDRYPVPGQVTEDELADLVREILDGLPSELGQRLAGVPVRVEDYPSEDLLRESVGELDPTILGAFLGVPYPDHVSVGGGPVLPETIVLYRRNLELACSTHAEMRLEVEVTLLHEIGHWLGLDEDDLSERGLA